MFVDIKEKVAIVEAYINHLKEQEVRINMEQFRDMNNVIKLEMAYQIASQYFQQNNGKIELLNNAR